MYQLCLHEVADLIVLLDFARQGIGESVGRTCGEIVDITANTVK